MDEPARPARNLYDPAEVRALFDEMAGTYGVVHLLSSFGFCRLWRRQTVAQVAVPDGGVVADLMSGMGELWPSIVDAGRDVSILAVDISPEMTRRAALPARGGATSLDLRVADVLSVPIEPGSVDVVVSSFGLKTFDAEQIGLLARRIADMLRPGGVFSLTEISVPRIPILRELFMAYLSIGVPLIGRLLLGNPDNYRMLGAYTRNFGSAEGALERFQAAGLQAELRRYFFGCATGVVGSKPQT